MKKKRIIIIVIIIIPFMFWYNFMLPFGEYNKLCPYIDTKFSDRFCPNKFSQVKMKMKLNNVELLWGKPIKYVLCDTTLRKRDYEPPTYRLKGMYSIGGKWKLGKYAWKSFDVYYNKDSIVVGKYSKWWND